MCLLVFDGEPGVYWCLMTFDGEGGCFFVFNGVWWQV